MTTNVDVMTELDVLNSAMLVGFVQFSYFKADGSVRVAVGTRNRFLIEKLLGRRLNGENTNYYENQNGYFDVVRMDWRQFRSERFIHIWYKKMTTEQVIGAVMALDLDENKSKSVSSSLKLALSNLVDSNYVSELEEKIVTLKETMPTQEYSIQHTEPTQLQHSEPKIATSRSELIKELIAIRKRESEILELLLA